MVDFCHLNLKGGCGERSRAGGGGGLGLSFPGAILSHDS